jgi:hypothetical protein
MVGYKHEHETMLAMLAAAPATLKLVIAGNHDINLDSEYFHRQGRKRYGIRHTKEDADTDAIRELWTGEKARKAGIMYLDEGLHHFRVKTGAIAGSTTSLSAPLAAETEAQFTIYASPYTPEFCGWAFAYPHNQDRFNPPVPTSSTTNSSSASASMLSTPDAPNPVPSFPNVDIMLTHGPPYGIRDHVVRWRYDSQSGLSTTNNFSVGCKHLRRAVARARPRLHVFGHIHEGFGAERHDWSATNPATANQNTNEAVTPLVQDPETVVSQRYCYYDASCDGKEPLRWGDETIFVNAAVVTVQYKTKNAPWVVDLDLSPIDEVMAQEASNDPTLGQVVGVEKVLE